MVSQVDDDFHPCSLEEVAIQILVGVWSCSVQCFEHLGRVSCSTSLSVRLEFLGSCDFFDSSCVGVHIATVVARHISSRNP